MAVSERDQSWMGGIRVWSVVWYRRYVIYRQMRTHKFSGHSMELLRLPFLLITPFKSMFATMKDQIFIEKLYIHVLTQYLYRLHLDSKYMSWSWWINNYPSNPVHREVYSTGIWPMNLNFPVFATGVRIFRASNDVGSWVHTNTRKKHKVRKKMAWYC